MCDMTQRIIFLTALLFAHTVLAGEQPLSDPMRPPTGVVTAPAVSRVTQWQLTAILISPERRLATINNQVVAVGEKIGGARVKAIYGHAVELDVNGSTLVLKPQTQAVRRDRREQGHRP